MAGSEGIAAVAWNVASGAFNRWFEDGMVSENLWLI